MLENINLKRKLSHEEYNRALPLLQHRLYDLEKASWDNGVPTVIVFEGWDASGKGTATAALTQRLDPRGFRLYPITTPRTYEQQYPASGSRYRIVVSWSSSIAVGTFAFWTSASSAPCPRSSGAMPTGIS
jgi:hypothetical protein